MQTSYRPRALLHNRALSGSPAPHLGLESKRSSSLMSESLSIEVSWTRFNLGSGWLGLPSGRPQAGIATQQLP